MHWPNAEATHAALSKTKQRVRCIIFLSRSVGNSGFYYSPCEASTILKLLADHCLQINGKHVGQRVIHSLSKVVQLY